MRCMCAGRLIIFEGSLPVLLRRCCTPVPPTSHPPTLPPTSLQLDAAQPTAVGAVLSQASDQASPTLPARAASACNGAAAAAARDSVACGGRRPAPKQDGAHACAGSVSGGSSTWVYTTLYNFPDPSAGKPTTCVKVHVAADATVGDLKARLCLLTGEQLAFL